MTKHLSLLLAVVLLALAFAPASADVPVPLPTSYSVTLYGGCWLPNGAGMPTNALKAQPVVEWGVPMLITASCRGYLPDYVQRPKTTLKLTFEDTQRPCRVEIRRQAYVTTDYGATVYPDGVTEITCRVDMDG